MGEVYRARDSRLDRDVAIKVSAIEFSERFAREARSIAALNHANVCHLYDVGPDYLVLEYVEGENLSGPMPFERALPIIRQLIDGIEAAHEKNIVHRDLKTANIRITPEGVVKILDFGLAKAAEPESRLDPANSPTFTMGVTQAGVIVGTAAYMAPEQARGKAADRRSDIWSFGVVVYELLTGRTPFAGESAVEILGAVINREPDWSDVPPRAERLLRWCLQKDRRHRLAAIGDARILLEESGTPAALPARPRHALLWPGAAAGLLLLAAAATYGWWAASRPVDRPLMRFSVDLGPQAIRGPRVTTVISPDGSRLVFTGRGLSEGLQQLFTRRLDQADAEPLPGTSGPFAETPFFSPDGDWIGYYNGTSLMKVAVQGGNPVQIAEVSGYAGGTWSDDGTIIVGSITGMLQVPASGGVPRPVGTVRQAAAFPDALPGGRAVLFNTVGQRLGTLDQLDIDVVDLETGQTKTLVREGFWPRYLPTSADTGHLAFIRGGTLFGVPFDPARLEISGTPIPLVTDVATGSSITTGGGQFASSRTGTFVYLSGSVENRSFSMQWLKADGGMETLLVQPGTYNAPRLSPDGTRVAYTVTASSASDVWVYDISRDTPTQLTFSGPGALELAWAPDSRHLVFTDGVTLWWVPADGSTQPVALLDSIREARPFSFAPDGRLAYVSGRRGAPDVWTLPLDLSDPDRPRAGKPEPFLADPAIVEVDPAFSPDGRLVAYASNESGREEVFVRPFPGPGGKWKVSNAGGKFPTWSRTSRHLYFLGGDDRIMVVDYALDGNTFSAGRPRPWSPTPIRRDGVRQNFDMTADGTRAVVFPPSAGEGTGPLHATFLLNFFDEIRRRIP